MAIPTTKRTRRSSYQDEGETSVSTNIGHELDTVTDLYRPLAALNAARQHKNIQNIIIVIFQT